MSTDYNTKQLTNHSLQLTQDSMEPNALECVEFARVVAAKAALPGPA